MLFLTMSYQIIYRQELLFSDLSVSSQPCYAWETHEHSISLSLLATKASGGKKISSFTRDCFLHPVCKRSLSIIHDLLFRFFDVNNAQDSEPPRTASVCLYSPPALVLGMYLGQAKGEHTTTLVSLSCSIGCSTNDFLQHWLMRWTLVFN